MTFNRIQLLRNKPIKISRSLPNLYFHVQGPTIGEVYDNDKLFLVVQILMMEEAELKKFLKIEDKLSKLEILTLILTKFEERGILLIEMQKVILGLNLKDNKIFIDKYQMTKKELELTSEVLQLIMGQKNDSNIEEENLTPEEIRVKELEKKVQEKKKKQEDKKETNSENLLENIIMAVIYEFRLSIEEIMNMNYFTLIWHYSYTSKLHVYRINQSAIGSGMVKKINTDYFTNLK